MLAQSSNNPFQDIPVTAPLPGGGAFVGTLDITSFEVIGGTLTALGTLTGTFHQPGGVTTPALVRASFTPVRTEADLTP